jgi:hypothetical protein
MEIPVGSPCSKRPLEDDRETCDKYNVKMVLRK